MSDRRLTVMLASLVAFLLVPALAGAATADWEYRREILGELSRRGVVGFRLPPEVFDRAQPGLGDLRIVDSSGNFVPFLLSGGHLKTPEGEESFPTMLDYSHGTSVTTFLLDLGQRFSPVNGIGIDTPESNFLHTVEVEGSHDMDDWFSLTTDGMVVDFQGEVHFRSTEVGLPPSTYRYLRVSILRDPDTPFEVWGARVFFVPEGRVPHLEALHAPYTYNFRENPSIVYVDLGYGNLPSNRLVLRTGDGTFQRRVTLWGSHDGADWRYVTEATLTSLDLLHYRMEMLSLDYDAMYRFLKVEVHDGDNPPLDIMDVRVLAYPREVVFEGRPGERYVLFYGNPAASRPGYDLEGLAAYVLSQERVELSLGPELPNPAYRPPSLPWTEERPWLIWILVGVLAVTLSWLTLRKMASARD